MSKTWAQNAVVELEIRGWSLTAIAAETGLSLGSVSDLKQRRTKEPAGFERAMKLRRLHSCGLPPPKAQTGHATRSALFSNRR